MSNEAKSFTDSTGKVVRTRVLTVNLTKARLKILSVPFEARGALGSTEMSLVGLAERYLSRPEYRQKEWILVNGGFSSYQVDVPLGLLVASGKVYSTINREKPRSSSVSTSEFGEFRWSGILCQLQAGSWEILPAGRYTAGLCRNGLQAGPVPIEPPAKIGIAGTEMREVPYTRTVVCLLNEPVMKVIVTEDETHLRSLATWMATAEVAGGLGCRVALNLSGDSSSGMVVNLPGRQLTHFGAGSFPIPTALMFEPN